MRRSFFNVDIKRRHRSAEALRAYSEPVYPVKHGFFHFDVEWFGVTNIQVTAECLFRQKCRIFEIAADTHSDNDRRTWIAPGKRNGLHDKLHDIFLGS